MRTINSVIVHCTDSEFGDVDFIRDFHVRQRGWDDIGYHFLITNAYPTFDALHFGRPDESSDGTVHTGRPLEEIGAHAIGWNQTSIGVALVGRRGSFTGKQVKSLISCCRELAYRFEVPFAKVLGHFETGANKTCPDLDMDYVRHLLRLSS